MGWRMVVGWLDGGYINFIYKFRWLKCLGRFFLNPCCWVFLFFLSFVLFLCSLFFFSLLSSVFAFLAFLFPCPLPPFCGWFPVPDKGCGNLDGLETFFPDIDNSAFCQRAVEPPHNCMPGGSWWLRIQIWWNFPYCISSIWILHLRLRICLATHMFAIITVSYDMMKLPLLYLVYLDFEFET